MFKSSIMRTCTIYLFLPCCYAISALTVNASQAIDFQIHFSDIVATGVLNFLELRTAQTLDDCSSISTATSAMPTSLTKTSTAPLDINEIPSTDTVVSHTLTTGFPVVPTINVTNTTTSSFSRPETIFTSGTSRRRSSLSEFLRYLRSI